MENLKVVVCGDSAVGKTSLFITVSQNGTFPAEYIPTVFDNYSAYAMHKGKPWTVGLWDNFDESEDFDRLRPLSYPGTDVFLFAFAVNNQKSFLNLSTKWIPEVQLHGFKEVPYVIIGTKCDLRLENEHKPDGENRVDVHSAIARRYLRRAVSVQFMEHFPTDLISLILRFSEYCSGELRKYSFVSKMQIDSALNNELRYGTWRKPKTVVPFLEVSALRNTNLDNFFGVIIKAHLQKEADVKKKMCSVM